MNSDGQSLHRNVSETVRKPSQMKLNMLKFTQKQEFHGISHNCAFSQKADNFMENITAIKSWTRLIPIHNEVSLVIILKTMIDKAEKQLNDLVDKVVSESNDCGDESESDARRCRGNGRPWHYVVSVTTGWTQGRDTQSSTADADRHTPDSTTASTCSTAHVL